jgi:potassium-dependent mechanosensitive channel
MIARLLLMLLLATVAATPASAQGPLAARAEALRSTLAPPSGSLAEDRGDFLRRLLLASLERRQDLEQSLSDVRRLASQPGNPSMAPPEGVLALDDLRRELQQIDATLASDERRTAILRQERAATAAQLADRVANQRALTEARVADARLEIAALETGLAESATAELDVMLRLVGLQQENSRRQRAQLLQRLAGVTRTGSIKVSASDAATIEQRLRARATELRSRLAAAAATRAGVRNELRRTTSATPAAEAVLLKERLANADIDMELSREALTNVATEQAVWQVVLRFYRDGDASAVVEAREQGPALLDRLRRRQDFLATLSDQIVARVGSLSADLAQAPAAPDAADKRALRAVLQQRQQRVQAAMLDERQLASFIERMRAGFDERIGISGWGDRARLAAASVRAWFLGAWNFELFTVNQSIEVEGRKTAVPRGVTVGKLIKAPLLLVVGLWLAFRLTAWGERWLSGRRGMEEGIARLWRRWLLALLIAACVLASLALAGIPLAAFAFIGGAVAIGIGFGMQTLFKNLISGVLVLVERPFRLGDVIEVGGLRGTVVDIDLRTSVVRDSDGAETLIPNSALMEENVKNVTFRTRINRQLLALVVDGASDPRMVIEAMRAAASRHGQLSESPEPTVFLDEFAENGLRFVLHYWIELKPGIDQRRIASDLRLMVLNAFEEAGIRLASPPPRSGG